MVHKALPKNSGRTHHVGGPQHKRKSVLLRLDEIQSSHRCADMGMSARERRSVRISKKQNDLQGMPDSSETLKRFLKHAFERLSQEQDVENMLSRGMFRQTPWPSLVGEIYDDFRGERGFCKQEDKSADPRVPTSGFCYAC